LASAASEIAADLRGTIGDPEELAAAVAAELRLVRPDATTAGRQRAASKAAGTAAAPTAAEGAALQNEPGRGRRAAKRGRKAARRATVKARRSTAGQLVTQALGLTALYWVLRYPAAVTKTFDGLSRAFGWLAAPIPLGGDRNPSTGQSGSPISDPQPDGRR